MLFLHPVATHTVHASDTTNATTTTQATIATTTTNGFRDIEGRIKKQKKQK